jgi:hypothetical protein
MTTCFRWLGAFALFCAAAASTLASNVQAATFNVLWYSYAHPQSEYKAFYRTLATSGTPHSTGDTWNLTFWGPGDPAPDFTTYNVLVIHSGEGFRTGPPGGANLNPDYSGILANKAAITAARGNRTFVTGSDADFHAVRGDSGVCGTGSWCLDGALGMVINAVNWAAGGNKLGIVSFVDGNFPNSLWWDNTNSFLKDELAGYVSHDSGNLGLIDSVQATYPLNHGLTSAGISGWGLSFHGDFLASVPGYTPVVSDGGGGQRVKSIAKGLTAANIVVEYKDTADFPNSPGGHFFYASDPDEQAAVDSGAAGAFIRTGRQFKIGGASQVCRFYGSVTPGPNSHFFTVDTAECESLKAAQVTPRPTTVQQWNYEGIGFATTPVNVAANGTRTCPTGTLPVYRGYNNAFPLVGPKNPWDSNHRFSLQQSDIAEMVAAGWRDEGIVFCAPQ